MGKIRALSDTVICRYENLESLGKCFVPFVHMHLPSAFQGITVIFEQNQKQMTTVLTCVTLVHSAVHCRSFVFLHEKLNSKLPFITHHTITHVMCTHYTN